MKPKQIVKEAGDAALALLKLTHAAMDGFPPLKNAAGGALEIAELVKVHLPWVSLWSVLNCSTQKFKSNEKDWECFGEHVKEAIARVIESLPNSTEPREDLKSNIEKLQQ